MMSTVLTESTFSFAVKCCVAAALGAVIGAQREFSPYIGMFLVRARHTAVAPVRRAGLRTHVLVALGACLFTEASWSAFAVPVPAQVGERAFVSGTFNYDTSRVAAQVVSGIGFLGAGTIWRSSFGSQGTVGSRGTRDEVYGLTTAASLWTTAAVGMHCGGANQKDAYFLAPAFATALVVITLQALVHAELLAHASAFSRTTTKIHAHVTLVLERIAEDATVLGTDASAVPSARPATRDTSEAERSEAASANDPETARNPSAVLSRLVTHVERAFRASRVVSVGSTVEFLPEERRNATETRETREPREVFPIARRPVRMKITAFLAVVVPAAGGSLDLLDAVAQFDDVTEVRVDASGPRRRDRVREKSNGPQSRQGGSGPEEEQLLRTGRADEEIVPGDDEAFLR